MRITLFRIQPNSYIYSCHITSLRSYPAMPCITMYICISLHYMHIWWLPSLFINVPILNETYSSQHFIFPSRFNMTITFQIPLSDPPFKLPCLFLLICIINIDFINFAKQSPSLLTSLFLSYTFSCTTDLYSQSWKLLWILFCLLKC